jgi:hypothetical protein
VNNWPVCQKEDAKDLKQCYDYAQRERQQDVNDRKNFPNLFITGRRVVRVPSASNNVIAGDAVGDFNVTASFAYFLIANSGTPEWVRVAVGTF